jgi:Fe-S-cluster containining protein
MKEKSLQDILGNIKALAKEERKSTRKYFQRLGKRPPRELDSVVQDLHAETFEQFDCLECANCCKTTSPIFRDIDIDRIAQHLGVRPAQVVEEYLHLDEDGDYVLNIAPCPFLGADNYCSIYEARPRACREYPHTDRKNFHQILDLTLKNTSICPAAYRVVKRLKEELPV